MENQLRRPVTLAGLMLSLLWVIAGTAIAAFDLPPIPYTTACGPIAVYVAQRALGVDADFQATIGRCQWKDGELISLSTMEQALAANSEIDVRAVKLSPEQLASFVGRGGVAIVPIRKKSATIDHAVCVTGTAAGGIAYFDYPEMQKEISLEKLPTVWDGQALLVSVRFPVWLRQNVVWFVLPSFALAMLATSLMHRRRNFPIEPSQPAVPCN